MLAKLRRDFHFPVLRRAHVVPEMFSYVFDQRRSTTAKPPPSHLRWRGTRSPSATTARPPGSARAGFRDWPWRALSISSRTARSQPNSVGHRSRRRSMPRCKEPVLRVLPRHEERVIDLIGETRAKSCFSLRGILRSDRLFRRRRPQHPAARRDDEPVR